MPEVPDVGAIVQNVKARIKQIEDQLKDNQRLTDELERLRDALSRLEGAARARDSESTSNPYALSRPALQHARSRAPTAQAHRASLPQLAQSESPASWPAGRLRRPAPAHRRWLGTQMAQYGRSKPLPRLDSI